MLLQRIVTAIPLAIGVIWIILFQSSQVFFWLTMVITALAAYEWAKLAGLKYVGQLIYVILLCVILWVTVNYASQLTQYFVYAGVAWWFIVSLYLLKKQPKPVSKEVSLQKLVAGSLVIPSAVFAMNAVHVQHNGPEWLLYGLMLVWVADIGAYFSGKHFGKNKLAPAISPGKTREGLYGAIVAVCCYSAAAAYYFELDMAAAVWLLLLAIVLTLVSVAGDLYESVLKREFGVKDSGVILPGHGGILDRIDSVLAAMPLFMVGRELLLQPVFNP
ncbi:MAG: phosphatidate cytidylyltransferase [Gammaproteobacteria bacterium]|jgi:phosphatidate cytidylyltransferase